MRRPIGCLGWHVAGAGFVVVCDDGSVWRWHDEEGWMEYEAVPGTDAARIQTARERLQEKQEKAS